MPHRLGVCYYDATPSERKLSITWAGGGAANFSGAQEEQLKRDQRSACARPGRRPGCRRPAQFSSGPAGNFSLCTPFVALSSLRSSTTTNSPSPDRTLAPGQVEETVVIVVAVAVAVATITQFPVIKLFAPISNRRNLSIGGPSRRGARHCTPAPSVERERHA